MESAELKAVQAPLKDRYRDDPRSAVVTLSAHGALGDGVTCSIETGQALLKAGLHPATGGGAGGLPINVCSGDLLLQALVACAGVTLNAVATSLGFAIRDAKVHAEGDLDFRGTLGVAKDAPVGFTDVRLRFEIDSDLSAEQRATLLRLTERYCVVYQTLRSPPALSATVSTVAT
jgi:uncharacterized OsmC-like protein